MISRNLIQNVLVLSVLGQLAVQVVIFSDVPYDSEQVVHSSYIFEDCYDFKISYTVGIKRYNRLDLL